jgi:D-amino-acid oxidase
VGAGIIGVTTAYRVLERFPRGILTLDLVADAFSPNTTSDVAAGFWEPYNCPGTSQDELE